MNLNLAVGSLISGINPVLPIGIRVSVGTKPNADGSMSSVYATPGSITASIGGTVVGSISDSDPTILEVSEVLAGSLQSGDLVSGSDGTNALLSTEVISQLSGTVGGVGSYQLAAAPPSGQLDPCTVTSSSTVLNVTAVAQGVPQPGQQLTDSGTLAAGTLITGFISGQEGGPGLYSVNQPQTVAPEAMATLMTITAQVQPLAASDLRHMDMLNLQGSHKAFYFNASIRGIVRIALKGGDLLTLPNGSTYLVNQPQEPWELTAGWAKVIGTLQATS